MVIYTSHNDKGWQVTKLMHEWIDEVFMRHTVPDAQGFCYLFMDNMGAHDEASVLEHCASRMSKSLFPPPQTTLLCCSHSITPSMHSSSTCTACCLQSL